MSELQTPANSSVRPKSVLLFNVPMLCQKYRSSVTPRSFKNCSYTGTLQCRKPSLSAPCIRKVDCSAETNCVLHKRVLLSVFIGYCCVTSHCYPADRVGVRRDDVAGAPGRRWRSRRSVSRWRCSTRPRRRWPRRSACRWRNLSQRNTQPIRMQGADKDGFRHCSVPV